MTEMKPNIVVICGPTGIGKTSVAIEAASVFGGEIINADSMQIYKYMDIGTAKPTPQEQARVPHHLIDILEPDEFFDAAKFSGMAHEKIMELRERDILPFVVGGTGFYIKALVHGLFQAGSADHTARTRLKEEAADKGAEVLYKRLCEYDPDAAEKIHPNDTYRIIRAIEIYEKTGKTISEHRHEHGFSDTLFRALKIGLDTDREILYDRINQRVDAMIAEGFLDEVRMLLDRGYSKDLKAMQSIGYRHLTEFIQERLSYDEALRLLKRDTRRYAKRQLSWFRADAEVIWKEADQLKDICELIRGHLQ